LALTGQEPAGTGPGDFAQILAEAEAELLRGNLDLARYRWLEVADAWEEEAGAERPKPLELARALSGLAECKRRQGDYAAAKSLIERALRAAPELAEAQLLLGRLHEAVGRYAEALELYESIGPEVGEARYRRGWVRAEIGQREAARQTWRALADDLGGRDDWRHQCYRGLALSRLGEVRPASETLLRAKQMARQQPEPYLGLADLYYRVYGEAEGLRTAESEYNKVLQQNGEIEAALLGLYRSRKDNFLLDPEKTLAFLDRVLRQNPNSVGALTARAAALIDDRNFEEAVESMTFNCFCRASR
jgi:tetratricopeptide (TPR) repeat protein